MEDMDAEEQSPPDRAALAWGIEETFYDIWGKPHKTTPEARQAILKSLGVLDVDKALEEKLWAEWSQPLAPTIVLGRAGAITLSLPESKAADKAELWFSWEDSQQSRHSYDLASLPVTEETTLRGQKFIRKQLALPKNAPLGYHQVKFDESQSRLILGPDRCFLPDDLRAGGIGVSLYSVRSGRNWGCGDFTDLKALIDWTADLAGVSFLALNPLHSLANREPYNTSPYLPNSVFFYNLLYLDIEQIAESLQGGGFDDERAEIERLRGSEFVEYEAVANLKLRALKTLFRRFLDDHYERDTTRASEFRAYIQREGELLRLFATHAALDHELHRQNPDCWNFTSWPEQFRQPDSPAVEEFARQHWRSVLLYQYIQWQMEEQLKAAQSYAKARGLGIGLYHDLALAIDKFGADAWAHRPFYVAGCRVGSPPDDFAPDGQDWGFPPPNTQRHFQDGYRLFAESIRKNARHGGALRIDHVMRFFHLFWIPDGMTAASGTYVKDNAEDLLHILALESVRGRFVVVGEDLGTVPDELREKLQECGVLSYRLLYFEKDKEGNFKWPGDYPQQALASTTTHDLPTLAGFWCGRDIEARREVGVIASEEDFESAMEDRLKDKQLLLSHLIESTLLPEDYPADAQLLPELTGELHNAVIGFLASTPADLFMLPIEDLMKSKDQQNLPGTTAEYPNWRRKTDFTLEDLRQRPESCAYAAMLRRWLERSGRLN
jgi:4-alpha-glucanotransferase